MPDSATPPVPTGAAPHGELENDPRWQLAARVAGSHLLRRSQRLQELLLFIAKRSLQGSGGPIREQDIGAGVFGRPADYDTSQDTIVRVQTFQLRKRLKEYFETEGAGEPLVLDLPKGSYRLEFVARAAGGAGAGEAPPRWRAWMQPLGAVVLLLAGAAIGWQAHRLSLGRPVSAVDRFWRQAFGNSKPVDLVLGDSSVAILQDMLGRPIAVQAYQRRQWQEIEKQIADPARRMTANLAMMFQWTPFTDAVATRNLGNVAARNGQALEPVYARDFLPRHIESNNVILMGNRRVNPWMGLLEDRLNFQYGYDTDRKIGYFRNSRPLAGEEPLYSVVWSRQGYCRVAWMPNTGHSGSVLILSGTEVWSAEAGARFITSDEWIERLAERLAAAPGGALPHFEALLKTDLLVASSPRFELVAVRGHPEWARRDPGR